MKTENKLVLKFSINTLNDVIEIYEELKSQMIKTLPVEKVAELGGSLKSTLKNLKEIQNNEKND